MILIGDINSKRAIYLKEAAKSKNVNLIVVSHSSIKREDLRNHKVKIDPPTYESFYVEDLPEVIRNYTNLLQEMSTWEDIDFVNHPKAILDTLDKKECKNILLSRNINVTPVIEFNGDTYDDLKQTLLQNKVYNSFIKPNYGSGACGVIAYRINPRNEKVIIETALNVRDGRLINTKNIRKINNEADIKCIINLLLRQSCIIERWVAKSSFNKLSYDLRVVYQYGEISYVVPRTSKSSITNLHLNNAAIKFEELNLNNEVYSEIEKISGQVINAYAGKLSYAGIDLLLENGSLKPYVVEVNSQGDLIYQDIYDKNIIYNKQIVEVMNNE